MIIGSDADFTLRQNISTVFCVVYFIFFPVAKHAQQGFSAKNLSNPNLESVGKKVLFHQTFSIFLTK